MARPRTFDRDEALRKALLAFWEKGYDQTSTRDLTALLGISPTSLYAAFGDKRRLFDEAVAVYRATPEYVLAGELDKPTAREGIESMLYAAAAQYTDDAHPPGCMIVTEPLLASYRAASRAAIRDRVQRAVDDGELAPGTDVDALAGFYGVVVGGLSARSRDGATCDELRAVAGTAMAAWPMRHVGSVLPAKRAGAASQPGPEIRSMDE